MRIIQQQKAHTSNQLTSNRPFFRPYAVQLAKIKSENSDKMETNSVSPKQAKAKPSISSSFSTNSNQGAQAKNETGMPEDLKSGLETLSGEDLSGVRVHRNSSKPEAIQAYAFAQGQDIHLAPGQEKHLPHEGWHVVQQMQGRVQPTIQKKDTRINDDAALEKEADIMGAKAVQKKAVQNPKTTNNTRFAEQDGVIQRAMKFEWQISGNKLYRDNGNKDVKVLPRKFGPEDYLVKGSSGVRFESEEGGDSEFETSWEKKWPKLEKQVSEAQTMAKQMNGAANVTASDGKTYKEMPFTSKQLEHLGPGNGFSKTGSTWNKTQKSGKRVVSVATENVRSSPEFNSADPKGNVIGSVQNKTKLDVVSESPDGKWIQFKSYDIDGWIWKASTILETKNYESNKISIVTNKKDSKGKFIVEKKYTDTELKSTDKLLVKLDDPTWYAGFQVSESFELNQYENYLKNDKDFEPNVSSHVSTLLALPSAKGASNEFKNFLLMVIYFIERTTKTNLYDTKEMKHYYAKAAFQLMSRTHFGSLYKSGNLTDQDRIIFNALVKDTKKGILPTLGLTTGKLMFMNGQSQGSSGSANPAVNTWLIGITQGKDLLSGPTGLVSAAMGAHRIEEEQGINKNLVRFENRNPKNRGQKVDDWLAYALLQFETATKERPRKTGKGETGLEK